MFIGGLSMNTTQESMRKYFESYGEVTDCALMLDRLTGKSRGFGFVTYKDPLSVQKVLNDRPHTLDGKTIDCKEAIPKSADPNDSSKVAVDYKTRKIFVGGLPHELTEDQFTTYFSKYGKVTHCQIMKDRDTGKSRGFGFVTFETEEAVDKVLTNIKEHKLLDKWVECKKATPSKPVSSKPQSQPSRMPHSSGYSGQKYGGGYGHRDYYQQAPYAGRGGALPRYTTNPFVSASAAGYPPQQTQYYPGGNGPYDQYPPPQTKMDGSSAVDFSQYQQPLQPQMYPPRYPPASSYQQMAPTYYEQPRGYPTASGPEARSYDPTQPAYGMPDPQVYMGYGKEPMGDPSKVPVSAPGIPAASYGYSKGFQPGYAGFYGNDPAAQFSSKHKLKPAEVAGRVEGGMEGGPMMPESKMDVFASSAFSQPLGLSFFPPPKSEEGDSADPNETKRKFGLNNGSYVAYGGGASYKPY